MSEPRTENHPAEEPPVAAICGLYCAACSAYLATHEDPQRLTFLAARLGQTEEETRCDGCRSERKSRYCRTCALAACAAERGHAFCGDCADFPCPQLEAFGADRPHRAEILQDLKRIREVGASAWMEDAARRYACPSCGTTNSAYDLKCRRCGHEPGCAYSGEHREKIAAFLGRR